MLTRPSPAALDSFAQIVRSHLWKPIEGLVRAELAAAEAVLRESTDQWALARAQGRAGFAKELLDLADKARS